MMMVMIMMGETENSRPFNEQYSICSLVQEESMPVCVF